MIDPLSDILALLKVESMLSARLEARGDWGFAYPAFRHMKFGGVAEGEMWLWPEGMPPTHLRGGDFYLLTDGRPYNVASHPGIPLMDGVTVLHSRRAAGRILRWGEDGRPVVTTAGRFTFLNDEMAGLFRFLPPLIHIPAQQAAGSGLAGLLPLILAETEGELPGGSVAASSIANLVLVGILRTYLLDGEITGNWLAGLGDPRLRAVLTAIHADVARPWTVDALASLAGMSRTAFTRHFRLRVGLSPLAYVLRWRMALAKAALRAGERNTPALADRLGYGSTVAFSIAFKREIGISPGRFRALGEEAPPAAVRRGTDLTA
ncbi:AraC family transcriptional regulator [Acetobacteraceae bacterium H6797]|nr:AraC family transcriptional regulator [Acetobacteraceae bacterium H6797]